MWEVCGCQSRARGDDSVKHLRVRSLPCRNPSFSFAVCARFFFSPHIEQLQIQLCMLLAVHRVIVLLLMFSRSTWCWFTLHSAAQKKPNDCSLWLIDLIGALTVYNTKVQKFTLIKHGNSLVMCSCISVYTADKSLHKWTKTIRFSFRPVNTEIQLCKGTTILLMW